MDKLRQLLQGKKAYITAGIGILGALAAWADNQIDTTALLGAVWAALSVIFLRSGINTAVKKTEEEKK